LEEKHLQPTKVRAHFAYTIEMPLGDIMEVIMINEVKQAIKSKLLEVYPSGYTIYDEELPVEYSKPAFYLTLVNQNYNRRMNNKYTSLLSFDLAYYSNSGTVRTDCLHIQQELLQAFHVIGAYRVLNRNAKITNNVLHITFDIRCSEVVQEDGILMQQQQTNTTL
jgi:hypothetical protein